MATIKLGTEINEDGRTEWRNNGGIIERKALYAENPKWETVANNPATPRSPKGLRRFCEVCNLGYEAP